MTTRLKHKRKDAPRTTATKVLDSEQGIKRLAVAVLSETTCKIKDAVVQYGKWLKSLETLRGIIWWLYAENREDARLPFEDACRIVNRDPDAVAEKMLADVPEDLTRICLKGKNYTCPLCGKKH